MTDNTKLTLSQEAIDILSKVTTATLTTLLLKKGLRNVWLRNTKPIRSGQPRLVGRAFTLRFVPAREDLATPESWASPISTRAAIEDMPAGCIAVVDSMGVQDDDGAVLIPAALLDAMLKEGPEQERMEGWIMSEVEKGVPLPGLYPMDAATKARYQADMAKQN